MRGEVAAITAHMEQEQEKERLARERVEALEVRLRTLRLPRQTLATGSTIPRPFALGP